MAQGTTTPVTNDGHKGVQIVVTELSGTRRAVLVGVNEYKNFRDLNYCGADVQALGQRLVNAGFDKDKVVVIHDNATRSFQPDKTKIIDQITLMLDGAGIDDLVVLAFSGHGVQIDDKSYLCPYEAEIGDGIESLIPLDWVYDRMKACRAAMKVMIIDACQNKLFPGDTRAVFGNRSLGSIAEKLQIPPEGIVLLTACAPGEYSHEDDQLGHGVYMHFILESLEGRADFNQDGIVSLKETDLYASDKTSKYVRDNYSKTQRPSMRGELQGDLPLAECLKMARITVPDDVNSIQKALERIKSGGTITIQPGVYRLTQPLEINEDITLTGSTSDPKDVVIESVDSPVFNVTADKAQIRYLSLMNRARNRSPASDESLYAARITRGESEIVKCDISSTLSGAVYITGSGTKPQINSCKIHDASENGIWVSEYSQPRIVDCDIHNNGDAGLLINVGGAPIVSQCDIHDGKNCGVFIKDGGKGNFESCEIYENEHPNVWICDRGAPVFRKCSIYDGKQCGVHLEDSAKGNFEDCNIYRHVRPNVCVLSKSDPIFKGCTIYDSKNGGIHVHESGLGTFDDCDIYGSSPNVSVRLSADPVFKDCDIHDSVTNGIYVDEGGKGTFENCDIHGCDIHSARYPAVWVSSRGDPLIQRCKIRDNSKRGIYIGSGGKGRFQYNTLYGNEENIVAARDAGAYRQYGNRSSR